MIRCQGDFRTGVAGCGCFGVQPRGVGCGDVGCGEAVALRGHPIECLDTLRIVGIVFLQAALEACPVCVGRGGRTARATYAGFNRDGREIFCFRVCAVGVGDVTVVKYFQLKRFLEFVGKCAFERHRHPGLDCRRGR